MKTFIFYIMCFYLIFVSKNIFSNNLNFDRSKSDTLKAQIDLTIFSGKTERYAKQFDRIKLGEGIHIHIKPETKNYLWIINVSGEKTNILIDTLINGGCFNVFPSKDEYFIFDGENDIEKIIIILSFNDELKSKIGLLSDNKLLSYIEDIANSSKCNISEKGEPLIHISGNLRDISPSETRMSKYEGIKHLIKEFKFDVKK
jgi:hypothetical protein